MSPEEFLLLLKKYTSGEILPEEHSRLLQVISSGSFDDIISNHIEINLQSDSIEGTNISPHRSEEILHKILSSEKQNLLLLPKPSSREKIVWWSVAATVIAALLFVTFITNKYNKKDALPMAFVKDMLQNVNTSAQPLKMQLEDGTSITFQPGAVLHYPQHFLPDKREVYLEGEAFFEVSKNPTRPFFVFNKNIVTHVLGTSFNVRINNETKQVEVSVRTGRVEVYENTTQEKSRTSPKNNGVILLPNQKVIYDETARQFVSSLVDRPLPVIYNDSANQKVTAGNMAFAETPLKTVLPLLEKNYGIEIVAENEALYKCLFTGDINLQELYTKLDVICQAVGATYEVKGTKILIKGKGCN